MRYDFVLFDVGQTLVGPAESFGTVYARVYRRMGVDLPADCFERAIREVLEQIARDIPPGTDRYRFYDGGEDEYWLRFSRAALARAGGQRTDPDFSRRALETLRSEFASRDAWVVFPDVLPALRRLRDSGIRMGVVSNWDSRLPAVLELLDLRHWFEALGVSHLEGVEKPDPALFHVVIRRLGADPDRTLHVGDLPQLDLAGARAAGIDGVLIDRAGTLGLEPSISDLEALVGIVRDGLPGRS